jgi:cytochrome oxidase Cu insertion factor (SCO1/SenC/PrrC family)
MAASVYTRVHFPYLRQLLRSQTFMPMRNAMIQGKCVLGFAAIVCLWLVASVYGADPGLFEAAQMEHLPRPIPIPEISLPDLEGQKTSLRSLKGQVVLMNFWTTW